MGVGWVWVGVEGREWVTEKGEEMTQTLYAYMNKRNF
jgi:hypothetical protein